MINYLTNSIRRKIARRVTKKYPFHVDSFYIEGYNYVNFTNWDNPLVHKVEISLKDITFFKRFLKEGDVAIDIGANIGQTSVLMSLITGKNGLVLAFDPNPYVFEILVENTKLNPDNTHIVPHNVAITDRDDEFYYNSSEASFNNGGISMQQKNRHGTFSLETKVNGIQLEKFLLNQYPDKVQDLKLIKIDTEGYDKEIIKSISSLLNKHRPVLITECFGKNSNDEKFEQYETLNSLGYTLYYCSSFDSNAEIVHITRKEDMLKWKHFDLYAIAE